MRAVIANGEDRPPFAYYPDDAFSTTRRITTNAPVWVWDIMANGCGRRPGAWRKAWVAEPANELGNVLLLPDGSSQFITADREDVWRRKTGHPYD